MNKVKKYNPNDYKDNMMSKLLDVLLEEKIIFITIGTKGGSGKTTIANAWLVSILKAIHPANKIKFVEIDDNNANQLNYKNSKSVSNYQSIKLDGAEKAIISILADIIMEEDANICIDAGGGNDTPTLLKLINKMELKKKAKIVYVIPFNASYAEMKNVTDLVNSGLLEDNTVLYACNKVDNVIEYKNEFVEFFGNNLKNENYIKGIAKGLGVKDTDVLVIPNSPYYEMALKNGVNIFDFAQITLNFELTDYVDSMLEIAKEEDEEAYEKMTKEEKRKIVTEATMKHTNSLYVAKFINQYLPDIFEVFMTKMGKNKAKK